MAESPLVSGGATERYLAAIRATPRPSSEQMRAFAWFVAGAHSWYKRLPLMGVGEPFFLYFDVAPHAACIEREDGSNVYRDVIREVGPRGFYECRIDLRPGDVDPGETGPLHYLFGGLGTPEYRERFGGWTYWNFGPPEQPRREALADAAGRLRVRDFDTKEMPVPPEILDLGLVYLRATISGELGPAEEEYRELQAEHELPDPLDDQAQQVEMMMSAMEEVTSRIFESG